MSSDVSLRSPDVDFARLAIWLEEKLQGAVRVLDAVAPKTGFSAKTLLLNLEVSGNGGVVRQNAVLRLEMPGHDIFLDTDLARQGEMMRSLRAKGIRAPVVIGIERDRSVLGGQFLVTELVPGVGLPQHPSYHVAGLLHDLDPAGRHLLWSDAISAIAEINRLDWRNGFDYLNRSSYGEPGLKQYLGWLQAWRAEAGGGRSHPVVDPAFDYLERRKPVTEDVAVLWGDSNIGNMVFAPDGHVAAVLDFEAAALGPGEIDLGWWFFMDDMLSFGVTKLDGLPDRAEQIALYEKVRGRKVQALDYYEILAGIRMALVMVRTTDRLIDFGLLPPDTRAAIANPIVEVLAARLGIGSEPTGSDYMDMVAVMNKREG